VKLDLACTVVTVTVHQRGFAGVPSYFLLLVVGFPEFTVFGNRAFDALVINFFFYSPLFMGKLNFVHKLRLLISLLG
jgi:hypothetical protein